MNGLELIQTLGPYLGAVCLLVAGGFIAAYLARRGVVLKRFKFQDAEVEFGASSNQLETREAPQARITPPSSSAKAIDFSKTALEDCEALEVQPKTVIDFVNRESKSHFRLFSSPFISMPLLFGSYICVLSWNGEHVLVERILKRKDAYPLNDAWISLLSYYRIATMLPYRTQSTTAALISRTEAARTCNKFRSLLHDVRNYLRSLSMSEDIPVPDTSGLLPLLHEAEFALHNDDVGTAVTRFEAVLSSVHKLLLQYVPSGVAKLERLEAAVSPGRLALDAAKRDAKLALVVEDDLIQARYLSSFLSEQGFSVAFAAASIEAMRMLTDKVFDIVIIDVLLEDHDGFEIVRVARASSPSAIIIVLTAFSGMASSVVGSVQESSTWDFFIEKSENSFEEIEAIIRSKVKR